jgi:hypothetical protein
VEVYGCWAVEGVVGVVGGGVGVGVGCGWCGCGGSGAVGGCGGCGGVEVWGCGGGVWWEWGYGCGGCGGVGVWGCGGGFPMRSNIPRSALCATLDTYNFTYVKK